MPLYKKSRIVDFIPQGTLPVGFFVNSEEILVKYLTAGANTRIIKLKLLFTRVGRPSRESRRVIGKNGGF